MLTQLRHAVLRRRVSYALVQQTVDACVTSSRRALCNSACANNAIHARPTLPCSEHIRGALVCSRRTQVSAADKKFHCTVCFKSFRLEMAATLHLKQSHNGEGSVAAGPGPGQGGNGLAADAKTSREGEGGVTHKRGERNTDPTTPNTRSGPAAEESDTSRGMHKRRPIPKPLHEPDREIAADMLEALLEVWDAIGVSRLGSKFVHSSMIRKVFATGSGRDAAHSPGRVSSSFVATGSPVTRPPPVVLALDGLSKETSGGNSLPSFADTEQQQGNPSSTNSGGSDSSDHSRPEPAAPAPVFGELPMFGQSVVPPSTQISAAATSPSSADFPVMTVASPFHTRVDSPFANPAVAATNNVSSPLSPSCLRESDDISQRATGLKRSLQSTPFSSASNSSAESLPAVKLGSAVAGAAMDGSSIQPSSPFTATVAASPFLAMSFQPSVATYTEAMAETADSACSSRTAFDSHSMLHSVGAELSGICGDTHVAGERDGAADAAQKGEHGCTLCGRFFASYDALRVHSRQKHNVDLTKKKDASKAGVHARHDNMMPELPSYIPSPVDLTLTTPFDAHHADSAWASTEVKPYGHSMSNMSVMGEVVEVRSRTSGSTDVTLCVYDNDHTTTTSSDDDEERRANCCAVACSSRTGKPTPRERITLRCFAECHDQVKDTLKCNDVVFATGSLRLLPVREPNNTVRHSSTSQGREETDKNSLRRHSTPFLFIKLPFGMIAKVH